MKFGDLTYEEIGERARQGWLAIVPTGCTEQQGLHHSVDFDTWFAEQICLAASEKAARDLGINSLVLPVMPFGPTYEHKNYGSGYIDVPKDLHEPFCYTFIGYLRYQLSVSLATQHIPCMGQHIQDYTQRLFDRSGAAGQIYYERISPDRCNRSREHSIAGLLQTLQPHCFCQAGYYFMTYCNYMQYH